MIVERALIVSKRLQPIVAALILLAALQLVLASRSAGETGSAAPSVRVTIRR